MAQRTGTNILALARVYAQDNDVASNYAVGAADALLLLNDVLMRWTTNVKAKPKYLAATTTGLTFTSGTPYVVTGDNTATTMFTITLGDDTDGGGIVDFCAMATSATTDRQKTCGQIAFSGVDVTSGAGGEACSAAITGTNSTAVSVGTLTVTGSATTGTDLCNIRITSDSSLNVAHTVRYSVRLHPSASTVVITPQ